MLCYCICICTVFLGSTCSKRLIILLEFLRLAWFNWITVYSGYILVRTLLHIIQNHKIDMPQDICYKYYPILEMCKLHRNLFIYARTENCLSFAVIALLNCWHSKSDPAGDFVVSFVSNESVGYWLQFHTQISCLVQNFCFQVMANVGWVMNERNSITGELLRLADNFWEHLKKFWCQR